MKIDDQDQAAMQKLAADLESRGLLARPVNASGPARIQVTNPAASRLSEVVIVHAGAFWWPWRDRIGPGDDVPGAAAIIARVLAVADEKA